MAKLHTTSSGFQSLADPATKLSSLQLRVLIMCHQSEMGFYDVVTSIRTERELQLLNEDIIAREVANLCTRGLVVLDRGKQQPVGRRKRGR